MFVIQVPGSDGAPKYITDTGRGTRASYKAFVFGRQVDAEYMLHLMQTKTPPWEPDFQRRLDRTSVITLQAANEARASCGKPPLQREA